MRRSLSEIHLLPALLAAALALATGGPARAIDGAAFSTSPTYYEEVSGSLAPGALESSAPGLPISLNLTDSTATVQYAGTASDPDRIDWQVSIRGLFRKHERVDAVYQMVLVLPLPADPEGRDAFRPLDWRLTPREGNPGASVPLIYGGERVALKRNRALEAVLLPNLVDPAGSAGGLPSLDGTGYRYTLWDTIIRYDPEYGDTVQLFMDVRYTTDADVIAPDPTDDRLKVYVVTWIPSLDPSVPPFALRMDVIDSE